LSPGFTGFREAEEMAVWLVRAGSRGERQDLALDRNVVVAGWHEMPDLSRIQTREEMEAELRRTFPDAKQAKIANWLGQLWAFAKRIQPGDLAVLPLKGQDAIAVGRVTGEYQYRSDSPLGAQHTRPIEWIAKDIPRSRFDQDLLFSLGAFLTICQIQRNNAEQRIRTIVEGGTQPSDDTAGKVALAEEATDLVAQPDVEQQAKTLIRDYISQKFTGHRLADLVNEILEVQGYKTQKSPPGPDGGVDITAGRGPMGFDPPRLVVQVKSGDQQQDVKVLRELRGVMKGFGAEQGVFVAWGGFRRTAFDEARRTFFEIRL
jgi:restriction system protein